MEKTPTKLKEQRYIYYSANSDFPGNRQLHTDCKESVSFRERSFLRIWYNDLSINFTSHWHPALEIIMPIESWYDVKIKDESFHIVPGEILLIPSGVLHEIIAPETGKRFIFMFDLALLSAIKGFSGIQSILAQPLYITKSFPIYNDVCQLLQQMQEEYFSSNEFNELTILATLIHMLTKFGYNHINTKNLFPNVKLNKQKDYVAKFNLLLD